MKTIKFTTNINKNKDLYFCDYHPSLDKAIQNFRIAKTVHVLRGVCYIKGVSFSYFTELLRNQGVSFSMITYFN